MNIEEKMVSPVNVFYSYAPEDELLRNEINRHLSTLRRRGLIREWYDRDIQAGSEWMHEIDTHLEGAHIILLLISSDFMHSDYCYSVEMTRALQKHRLGEARIIPIILRPVDWDGTPIAPLSVLPSGGIPITSWQNRDEAFNDVAKNIRKVIELDAPRLTKKPSIDEKEERKAQIIEANQETSSNKSEASKNTFSGSIHIKQDAEHISQTLNNLANQVGDYDYGTRVQLRSLKDAVSTGLGADIWSAANIYKIIDPDIVVERFKNHLHSGSTIKRIMFTLQYMRNILMPALLASTLLAIAQAITEYERFVRALPTAASQSFLFLWAQGFGGSTILTPQVVLMIDVILALFFMYSTLIASWLSSKQTVKKEQDAHKLREEIIEALIEASTYLRLLYTKN